jgi:hypothetical protein
MPQMVVVLAPKQNGHLLHALLCCSSQHRVSSSQSHHCAQRLAFKINATTNMDRESGGRNLC